MIDRGLKGGGGLDEDIEVVLSGEKYVREVIGGGEGWEMGRGGWKKGCMMVEWEGKYCNGDGRGWV